ncbi:MAG: hypothetical protein Q8P40_10415, partial [Nitrospirota bacterium]|nr:hypothetical protein [Nitrospirota bacterium]
MPVPPVVQHPLQTAIEGELPFNEILGVTKTGENRFKPGRGGAGAAQGKMALAQLGGGKPFACGVQTAEAAIAYEGGEPPLGMNYDLP